MITPDFVTTTCGVRTPSPLGLNNESYDTKNEKRARLSLRRINAS